MNCVYYLEEKKNNNRMKLDFLAASEKLVLLNTHPLHFNFIKIFYKILHPCILIKGLEFLKAFHSI